jgi:hypothetical protein
MALSDEQSENADSPIFRRRHPDAKLTTESKLQEQKQNSQIISTEAGIQIDFKDEHSEKAPAPIIDKEDRGSNKTTSRDGLG